MNCKNILVKLWILIRFIYKKNVVILKNDYGIIDLK